MDKCGSDAEFDSYWDYEAKNKNRNRIRVGRQYQASVPPLLKPGEKDGRKCEDLETLKWKPNQMNDQEIEQYLSMANAVTSFAKVIENCRDPDKSPDNTLQTAIKGLTEFVTSHHPCHHDAGCKVPISCSSSTPGESSVAKTSAGSDWTAPEAHLFAQAIESCGKNFCAIKKEYLPWKPVRSLIEYYYGKSEKLETPATNVPSNSTICKIEKKEEPSLEKAEPVASCSHDSFQEVPFPHTKEESHSSEEVKEETELQATPIEMTSESSQLDPITLNQLDGDATVQSTVGSLKFFLGGRLVLKLNAQQDNGSGAKCQWVQSNDTPKHSHQVKKVKHRRKVFHEVAPPGVIESPKHKKKNEDNAVLASEGAISAIKKAKLRPYDTDAGCSSLCSVSWTPPVADGPDSVELEECSKTSEGCVSPVVMGTRIIKTEVRTDAIPVDPKRKMADTVDLQDHKPWLRTEPSAALRSSQSEGNYTDDYITPTSGFAVEKFSPKSHGEDISYSYEVLNHKSALTRMKSSCFLPRAAHSSSPSAKLFNKWPSASADFLDKVKSSPNFHSPNSRTCSTSSESSVRDFVLDLSSRLDTCESQETCCRSSPAGCTENCSSSEGSPHTPCSANDCTLCCKSSNCSAYHTDVPASLHELKELDSQLGRTNFNAGQIDDASCGNESADIKLGSSSASNLEDVRENCIQCSCCYNPSTSCASPKCCKSYSSKEQVCIKEDNSTKSPSSSPNSIVPPTDEVYSKKVPPWFGTSVTSLVHSYPYYVAYGVNPFMVPNSSTAEIPLDLSSNGNKKEEQLLPENVPAGPTDLPKNSADALDRGMLYQLLKNKVTK